MSHSFALDHWVMSIDPVYDTVLLPSYASAGTATAETSVRPSVHHTPTLTPCRHDVQFDSPAGLPDIVLIPKIQ